MAQFVVECTNRLGLGCHRCLLNAVSILEYGFAQDDRNRDHQPDEQNDDGERRHRITASLPEDALSAQVYRERDPERDERGDEDDGERCHRIHS